VSDLPTNISNVSTASPVWRVNRQKPSQFPEVRTIGVTSPPRIFAALPVVNQGQEVAVCANAPGMKAIDNIKAMLRIMFLSKP
jgi:hypothetical protein